MTKNRSITRHPFAKSAAGALPFTHSIRSGPWGIALLLAVAFASAEVRADSSVPPGFDHQHHAWSDLLGMYVKSGQVDYKRFFKAGRPALQRYLQSLEAVEKREYAQWNKAQKIAFWINVYNAYTIELVFDHYPLKSLQKVGAKPGDAWRKVFIPLEKIAGRALSLHAVENEILRKRFDEPRIHFALNCASMSCPVLLGEAFTADRLAQQLDRQTRLFLRDQSKNRYNAASNTLYLSKIFDWYKEDFGSSVQSMTAFVAKYLTGDNKKAVTRDAPKVEFLAYDWALNGK